MRGSGDPIVDGVAIDDVCTYLAQTAVVFAILFGSRARGTANGSSDVDIALRFPDSLDEEERFHRRNRIDAALQEYAEGFVDVSDIDALPTTVAYAALRDGMLLTGDEQAARRYQAQVEREYEASASERDQRNREFIDRLASGDV